MRQIEDGQTCVRAAQAQGWFKCVNPERLCYGGVILCTVQCRPASARVIKSPPRGCTLKSRFKYIEAQSLKQAVNGLPQGGERLAESSPMLPRAVRPKGGGGGGGLGQIQPHISRYRAI